MVMASSGGTKGVSDVRSMVPEGYARDGWPWMMPKRKGTGESTQEQKSKGRNPPHPRHQVQGRVCFSFFLVGCPFPRFFFRILFFLNYLFITSLY